MQSTIEAMDVRHQYGDHQVLSDISLAVGRGEIWGLLGPSGAGKTTLIRILTGQLRQSGGKAMLLGTDTRRLTAAERSRMGAVLDNTGLYKRLTVGENMRFFADVLGASRKQIDESLGEIGLLDAKGTRVSRLSKGMRARLTLARALLGDPEILFADEPTSGLDPATMRSAHAVLRRCAGKGTTIVLTTHNMSEASILCDRIALLSGGRIIESGPPAEICARHDSLRRLDIQLSDGSRVLLENGPAASGEVEGYLRRGLVRAIHSTEPTLEDVFISLTGKGLEQP